MMRSIGIISDPRHYDRHYFQFVKLHIIVYYEIPGIFYLVLPIRHKVFWSTELMCGPSLCIHKTSEFSLG